MTACGLPSGASVSTSLSPLPQVGTGQEWRGCITPLTTAAGRMRLRWRGRKKGPYSGGQTPASGGWDATLWFDAVPVQSGVAVTGRWAHEAWKVFSGS